MAHDDFEISRNIEVTLNELKDRIITAALDGIELINIMKFIAVWETIWFISMVVVVVVDAYTQTRLSSKKLVHVTSRCLYYPY